MGARLAAAFAALVVHLASPAPAAIESLELQLRPEHPERVSEPVATLLHGAWIVPGALAVLVIVFWAARRGGGDAAPAYRAPAGLRAGEAGVLIDGHVHARDVVAAVVDLAVRGYLTLEPADNDVMVHVARPWIHDKDICSFETVLLAHVFTDGAKSVRLSALRGRGYAPDSIKDNLSHDLAELGLFAAGPRAVLRVGRVAAVAAAAIWLQVLWNEGAGVSAYTAAVTTGGMLWLLVVQIARGGLTPEGVRARRRLEGYREYLRRVEKHRLEALPPGALDEHLPWAIALGVTEGWLG